MRHAQIKDGVVKNIIVIADPTMKQLFGVETGFNALVRVEGIMPQPQIGWTYDSDTQQFSAPADAPEEG